MICGARGCEHCVDDRAEPRFVWWPYPDASGRTAILELDEAGEVVAQIRAVRD